MKAEVRTAVAAVYYDGADPNGVPTSLTAIDPARLLPCGNDPLNETVPAVPISSDPIGSLTTVEMHINFTQVDLADGTFMNEWTINDVSYVANYSRSLLQDAIAGNTMSLDDQSYVYNLRYTPNFSDHITEACTISETTAPFASLYTTTSNLHITPW